MRQNSNHNTNNSTHTSSIAGGTGGGGLDNANNNPTVLNARWNEVNSSLANMILILTITIPQIIAAMCVLPLHWNTDHTCDDIHIGRWRWWATFSAVRMALYDMSLVYLYVRREWLQQNQSTYVKAMNFKNTIDAFGLVWFVVGNMWLFGDDDNSCPNPSHSPIYNLSLSMIIINYIQICLPCIIAILLIPVFCFCMPCLIRALARLQNARQVQVSVHLPVDLTVLFILLHFLQGASQSAIDQIPVITVTAQHFANGEENTCPICLSEMTIGESIRHLRCNHKFHQQVFATFSVSLHIMYLQVSLIVC